MTENYYWTASMNSTLKLDSKQSSDGVSHFFTSPWRNKGSEKRSDIDQKFNEEKLYCYPEFIIYFYLILTFTALFSKHFETFP
ncbi:hypothetical protein ACTXT7_007131 [Hymenolepis weldensis]